MHGIPPHLLPNSSQPVQAHFRCEHCGYDSDGARPSKCPGCGRKVRRKRNVPRPRLGALILVVLIIATLLTTWVAYRVLWARSDYVQARTRIVSGYPVPVRDLRAMCVQECVIRSGVIGLLGLGVCLVYAYWVFERARVKKLGSRMHETLGWFWSRAEEP